MFRHLAIALALLGLLGVAPADAQQRGDPLVPVYRFYHRDSGDHFYTSDAEEARQCSTGRDVVDEGAPFFVAEEPAPGLVPLYRFSKTYVGHMYSTDRRAGREYGARLEGVVGYIATRPRRGTTPLYEWYDPDTDLFFYTTDRNGEGAGRRGFQYEGLVGYVFPPR